MDANYSLLQPLAKLAAGAKEHVKFDLTSPTQARPVTAQSNQIDHDTEAYDTSSLRSKRFHSSYCAKVRAEAKKG